MLTLNYSAGCCRHCELQQTWQANFNVGLKKKIDEVHDTGIIPIAIPSAPEEKIQPLFRFMKKEEGTMRSAPDQIKIEIKERKKSAHKAWPCIQKENRANQHLCSEILCS